MRKTLLLLVPLLGLMQLAAAQLLVPPAATYTRADSLRGGQSALRTCYDVTYYHLDVRLDLPTKSLSGANLFRFTATRDFTRLQVDLFANLAVSKVTWHRKELPFTREGNAVFVTFPKTIAQGTRDEFTVSYAGQPTIAKKAPWDGGFVWAQDSAGRAWVATACQGLGASSWWPCKDQQADEVDSMLISIAVPKDLKDISNGRLRRVKKAPGNYLRYDWAVTSPINNYDVALNVGNYQHFSDVYQGERGPLTLDYWVLPENLRKARPRFAANVKPMLKSMEHWFGPYPFYKDGYKLVDAPYLGMEHQSAVAYGNKYQNGYLGRDRSATGWGSTWDFIIIHESGHEWFGNSLTTQDIADMWVHESFTTYSESLFVESLFGQAAGQEYLHGQRRNIQNDRPIIGPYGVNKEGSGDMYDKGANLLGMLRLAVNDDARWRTLLRGLNQTFYHQTVTGQQVIDYLNRESGHDFSRVFDQYLRGRTLPTLEIGQAQGQLIGRWVAEVPGFDLPILLRTKGSAYQLVPVTTNWQPLNLPGATRDNVEVDTLNYYVGVLVEEGRGLGWQKASVSGILRYLLPGLPATAGGVVRHVTDPPVGVGGPVKRVTGLAATGSGPVAYVSGPSAGLGGLVTCLTGLAAAVGGLVTCRMTLLSSHLFHLWPMSPTPPLPATPNPTGWVAPTEAGRAQQLLDAHPHLVAENLELRWFPNAALLTHATSQLKAIGNKGTAADQRPAQTAAKKQAIAAMSAPLTELRALLKKKFKDAYEGYYPQFGLVHGSQGWQLPKDHDELIVALRDQLLPALTQYGFDQDADTGTAVWQPLFDQLSKAQTSALTFDTARSAAKTTTDPQDEKTTKALRAITHLAQAHFPDTWETELRAWGWRKTSF